MNLTRRSLLLTALAAPAIIRTPGLLMPVRKVAPEFDFHRSVTADGLTLLQWSVDFERKGLYASVQPPAREEG